MHLALNTGPPTMLPIMGAGNTEPANEYHRAVFDLLLFFTCSAELSHVRPTMPDLENRRTPTLMALLEKPLVSSRARFATAADSTLTRGKNRYSSVIMMTELPTFKASMMEGVRSVSEAHVAPTPTHSGVMALTRSALARKASASAAH